MYKAIILLLMMMTLSACSEDNKQIYHGLVETEALLFYIDTLASGLQNPWGLEFLPDGRILIAERPGNLRIWADGELLEEHVVNLPEIWSHGQGGLLEVVMHPNYDDNQMIYLVHGYREASGGNTSI